MDRLSPDQRSRLMSRIRSKDTKPELTVRSTLHALGYRYVLHKRGMPGTPDLVFPKRGKVLFVHGCYWHGHTCKFGKAQSKSNIDFWMKKISANIARDRRNIAELRGCGWAVKIVWECQIKKKTWLNSTVRFLEK